MGPRIARSEQHGATRGRRRSLPEGLRGQIKHYGIRALSVRLSSFLLLAGVMGLGATRAAAVPKAIRLTNTDAQHTAYLRVPDASTIEPQEFTFEVWITPLGPGYGESADGWGGTILAKPREGGDGTWLASYWLNWDGTTHKLSFVVVHTYSYQGVRLESNASVSVGQTAHVAVVFDGQEMRLYVDGYLDNVCAFPYQGVYYGAEDVLIGAGNYATGHLRRFDGVIDDVRMWSHPRTQEEISMDMSCLLKGDEPGLLAWWSFDNDLLVDNSGKGHTAQMQGVPGMATFVPPNATINGNVPYVSALDPKGTYLRTHEDPSATSCSVIDLPSCGIEPGDTLRIYRNGAFEYHCTAEYPEGIPDDPDGLGTICVFSSSNILLSSENAARVPGAIEAGEDYVTAPTLRGSLPTDIPEDFAMVDSVSVVVPAGALYLFVAANDVFYGDNCDPNGDYAATLVQKWACPNQTSSAPENAPGNAQIVGSAWPNPSSKGATIELRGSGPVRNVKVSICDVAGREVRALASSGDRQVFWDGADHRGVRVPAGVYFVRVSGGRGIDSQRLVIVR
jgi:hypothetical protein